MGRIKSETEGKWDLFHLFLQFDRNRDLYLDTPGDIANIFAEMNMEIPINHYEILFDKFKRSNKFEYLVFLRFFMDVTTLFLRTSSFLIDELFDGKFDKFYDKGLSHGRRKWNRDSLIEVYEELEMGFTNNELGAIWDEKDTTKDGSLSTSEVAAFFRYSCESDEKEGDLLGLDSV